MLRRILIAVIALSALTACSTAAGPQVGAGTAAVVGNATISSDLVDQRLRTAAPTLAQALDQQAQQEGRPSSGVDANALADQSRDLLTTAILHQVVVEAARREGIVIDPALVEQRVQAAGGPQTAAQAGYDLDTLRELIFDQIAVAEIGRRQFDRLTTTVDVGTFPDRATAQRAATQLAADPGIGPLAALPADGRIVGATLRPGTTQPGEQVRTASSLLFGLPGRTVSLSAPQQETAPGAPKPDPTTQPWTVVRVRDRSLSAPPPSGNTVPAALVDNRTMTQFGLRAIQPVAAEIGVQVNPRYGTWDPTQVRVVAPPAAAGSITPLAPGVAFPPTAP
ncbi:hypothetical protein [Actinomycetospora termitidis]|uniref:SurA-like protein n=1 Tax=Actinomycetospora termitidis TaxID=3053470 RepID=A0ABT7MAH9_9PSEU|nr:hypothetical protein [Actinomycetospora sp. Odt1-22]MDL5157466.1 hypothetical protein [Actinomycetospora sp. Odt1-22]